LSEAYCTAILRGLTVSAFGNVTVKIPWSIFALIISGETARHDEYTAMVSDSQDELRQQLLKYKHVGSNSYKLALSVALDDDDLLVEEIE
jgi:hypothetical protein